MEAVRQGTRHWTGVRSALVAASVAMISLALAAPPAFAVTFRYAGVSATSDKLGIRGYILEPTRSDPVDSNSDWIGSWIGLCAYSCTNHSYVGSGSGLQWVQLGMFQGLFKGGYSPSYVHLYYENEDPCGAYHGDDVGSPSSNPLWFRVQYDGSGLHNYTCANGTAYTAYRFEFKKISSGSTAFYTGKMLVTNGRADANVELHNSPAQPNIYFGCASSSTCLSDYGIYTQSSSGWSLMNSTSNEFESTPPFLQIIHGDYSFKVCGTYGPCS